MGFSIAHLLVVLVVVLLLFGAGRVPGIAENLAKGINAFKRGLKDEMPENKKLPPKDDQMS
jgi:sec-independent protein translocase protein TatA